MKDLEVGRVALPPGSKASPDAPAGHHPSGYDLSRDCRTCEGHDWVCENHRDRPWAGFSASSEACDCGAGAPCGSCNLEMASAGYVDRREKRIAAWLTNLPAHYSGSNHRDEAFDSGWSGAVAWIANCISNGKHWNAVRDSDGNPKGGDGTAPSQSDDSAGLQGIAQPHPQPVGSETATDAAKREGEA